MAGGTWWTPIGAVALAWAPALVAPAGAAAPVFTTAAPIVADAASDAGNDGAARIVTDGQGTWVTVWSATRGAGGALGTDADVLAARSRDLGISWSLPTPVNRDAAADTEFDFAPALATDRRGLWIAVWVATNGPDTDLFVARSTDGGLSWSAKQALHHDTATDAANDDHPQLATDGHGTLFVACASTQLTYHARDVYSTRSTDDGATWSTPAPIGTNAATDRGSDQRPQLATDGQGRWIAVWASSDTLGATTGSDFDVLIARSDDAGATWTAAGPLNANAASDRGLDDRPQLATDGGGTWVAAWVSDENIDGDLGTDLDVLSARSTDGGVTWSWPAPVNGNAATDAGEDGAPALTTDGEGTWVAVWESTDSLGDTLGTDHDVLMAHSFDGGGHWSAPRALDPDAAGDTSRDIAPQLATGHGVWNAVWSTSGGALGTDSDVVRAGGRERCGDGVVDPGEQCDDGNVQGGDACPAGCEYPPPPATPAPSATPEPGGSAGGGAATPTQGTGGGTPGPDPSGGTTLTPTGTVSPSPGDGATLAAATPTPTDPLVPTPSSSDESTPAPSSTASSTVHADPQPTPSVTAETATPTADVATTASGAATPRPVPTFAGGLSDGARAKAAVGCQRAIVKAGAQLVGARLGHLGSCGRGLQRCVQTKPGDAACLAKAVARCGSAVRALATADRKQSAAVAKRCSGNIPLADVFAPAGLGFAGVPCGADAATLADLVGCVFATHACGSAGIVEILQPRAQELLRLSGIDASTLDAVACLPDHGGDGATLGDPTGAGKALDACSAAVVKAGTTFAKKRLARLAKCVGGLFACVQLTPDDGSCLAKARGTCEQGDAASAVEERRLTSAVAARCAESLIPYATLRAARAANLEALAAACAAVGVPGLASLADYQQCLVRTDACRVETLLAAQIPRLDELLGVVGRSLAGPGCAPR